MNEKIVGVSVRSSNVITITGTNDYTAIDTLMQKGFDSNNVDSLRNSLALSTETVSFVYCGEYPNSNVCKSKNRQPCQKKPQTCGECMKGYVGETGDSNTACVDIKLARAATLIRPSIISRSSSTAVSLLDVVSQVRCETSDTCGVWETCKAGYCAHLEKECRSTTEKECSGHGACIYVSSSGRIPLESSFKCYVDNESCTPICLCDNKYLGDTCSLTRENSERIQQVKFSLLKALEKLSLDEDLTLQAVTSWLRTIVTLYDKEEDMSYDTISYLKTFLKTIFLDYVSKTNVDVSSIVELQTLISIMASKLSTKAPSEVFDILNIYVAVISSKLYFKSAKGF